MDTKTILKWGLIIVVGYFALRWISNFASNLGGGSAQPYADPYGLYSPYYAAPLPPNSIVTGRIPPWRLPWRVPRPYGR